jgi:hypothetical protein
VIKHTTVCHCIISIIQVLSDFIHYVKLLCSTTIQALSSSIRHSMERVGGYGSDALSINCYIAFSSANNFKRTI